MPPSRTRSSRRRATSPESAASPCATPFEELGDPLRRLGLQQVAGRAGADRGEQVLFGARRGEDHDLAVGRRRTHPRQRLEPAAAGHRQVEQDEVGLELARALDRLVRRRPPRRRRGTSAARAGRRAPPASADGRRRRACGVPCAAYRQRAALPTRGICAPHARRYLAWVRDELVLVGAARGRARPASCASPGLRDPYDLPSLRLFLDTAVLLVSVIVCVLAYVRFARRAPALRPLPARAASSSPRRPRSRSRSRRCSTAAPSAAAEAWAGDRRPAGRRGR